MKFILIQLALFGLVFGIECTRTVPSLMGYICLSITAGCLGFCIALHLVSKW